MSRILSLNLDLVLILQGGQCAFDLLEPAVVQSRVQAAPEATVMIKNLGDNGIELELTTWIRDAEQGQSSLRSDIFVALLRAFREEGIDIAYPQREIRILGDSPDQELQESAPTVFPQQK